MPNNIAAIVMLCSHNGGNYIYDQIVSIAIQKVKVQRVCVFDFNSIDNTIDEVLRAVAYCKINSIDICIDIKEFPFSPGVNKSFIFALKNINKMLDENTWLYVCDQDDIWKIDKHDNISRSISRQKDNTLPVMFHHDVEVVDSNLKKIYPSYYDYGQLLLLKKFHKPTRYFGLVIGHTVCMNSHAVNLLSNINHNEQILMYDWYWGAVIEAFGKRIYIPKSLSLYRQHSTNLIGARINRKNISAKLRDTFATIVGVIRQCLMLDSDIIRISQASCWKFVDDKKNINIYPGTISINIADIRYLIKPILVKLLVDIVMYLCQLKRMVLNVRLAKIFIKNNNDNK